MSSRPPKPYPVSSKPMAILSAPYSFIAKSTRNSAMKWSAPDVRNMKLGSRSYSMFLVAAAIDSIIGTPPSWITGLSALAELESNLPMRA